MDRTHESWTGLLSTKQTSWYNDPSCTDMQSLKHRRRGFFIVLAVIVILFIFLVVPWITALNRANTVGPGNDIFNSTLGFQKLLVLNLPERTDHRDVFALQGSLTGLQFEFVDGVHGDTVAHKVLPPGNGQKHGNASVGSWRGHINALRLVVEQNLGSALIFEDDVDWDVRIKDQLQDFAIGSRSLVADPKLHDGYTHKEDVPGLDFHSLPHQVDHRTSAYGDGWDVLWLGHCGMRRPKAHNVMAEKISKEHVIYMNDETVPEKHYIGVFDNDAHPDFRQDFDDHTRVYHHAFDGICNLAYAVSQAGARKLLYEVGIQRYNDAFDIMLRQFCDGLAGHENRFCLTVQPALFDHHRDVGYPHHDGSARETAVTFNIRQSTRLNIPKLLKGETDCDDQYPDTLPP